MDRDCPFSVSHQFLCNAHLAKAAYTEGGKREIVVPFHAQIFSCQISLITCTI